MTPARKFVNAALLVVATGYYSTAGVAASPPRCEDLREACHSDSGEFYSWGFCYMLNGQACGPHSCGLTGTHVDCCWDPPIGC